MIKFQCKQCGFTFRPLKWKAKCLRCEAGLPPMTTSSVVEIGKVRAKCQKCGKSSENINFIPWDKYRLLVPLCETCAVPFE